MRKIDRLYKREQSALRTLRLLEAAVVEEEAAVKQMLQKCPNYKRPVLLRLLRKLRIVLIEDLRVEVQMLQNRRMAAELEFLEGK